MHIDQDGQRSVMRRYVDGARSRMETEIDGQKFIVIQLGDGPGTTYTLMPESRMAMKMTQQATARVSEAARDSTPADASAAAGQDEAAMERVGTETIDGATTEKYRVRMADADGFIWLDANSQHPVRMEAGGAVVALRNYDFSKPADDLFQVPKGYEVADVDEMMRSFSPGRMIARGLVGGVGSNLGGQFGASLGGSLGASIGGAVGGPIGAMVGQFLGQHFGKKAGTKAGAAAGKIVP
jgi:hypothetical protein